MGDIFGIFIKNMAINTSNNMGTEETIRIKKLITEAIEEERSKEEVFEIFIDAGIITKKGNLRAPYKEIYIPSEE